MKLQNIFLTLILCLFTFDASAQVFDEATGTAYEVFENLRIIAYILAGFGLAAFAVSAIMGKISFSWLAMICVGLFILSQAEGLAEYITGVTVDGSSAETPSGVSGGQGGGDMSSSGDLGQMESAPSHSTPIDTVPSHSPSTGSGSGIDWSSGNSD